jgi:D-aspartate ligase
VSGLDSIDTKTPVLIFGLSRGMFHHGALGVARSAGRLGIPVHRLGLERWSPAACSRYNRGWHSIPKNATADEILHILQQQTRRIGQAILVPIDDVSSVFVDQHAHQLQDAFLFPRQPTGLPQALSSKRQMYELCLEHGVPTPTSAFPESEDELLEHVEQTTFPVVLKCINISDAPPAAPRVVIAENRDELLPAYRSMQSPQAHNVMLQEYVPGTPESVWMFNGYFDDNSDCKIGITGKKIRQSPPYTGVTTLGACEPNPAVEETTVRLMKTIGYRGILDIGYRFDARDGQYKLLDVNPRIGGTFRLFVSADGMDVLRALYLDLTGQPVPQTSPSDGRRWLAEPTDLASSVTYRRRGDITLSSWMRSFRGVREEAWFAKDDPLPFMALWFQLLVEWLPRRALRRRSKPPEPALEPELSTQDA